MSGNSAQRAVVGIGLALTTIALLWWWQRARRRRILGIDASKPRLRFCADESRDVFVARLLLLVATGTSIIVICRPPWADAHLDNLRWTMLGFLLGGVIILYRRRRAYLRSICCDENGMVCVVCGYRLRGLPDRGTCPECGEEYTSKFVRRYWRRARLL